MMTTPRPHADKATLFYSDSSMRCWTRLTSEASKWYENAHPAFDGEEIEYYVGLTAPVDLVTLTLHVPRPMQERPTDGERYWYLDADYEQGYSTSCAADFSRFIRGIWRTEEEIKLVVAALESAVKAVQA